MFLEKAWKGNIAVWQAVILVSIIGFFTTLAIGSALGLALLQLKQSGVLNFSIVADNNYVIAGLLSLFGIFATRTLWMSASNTKGKISHALVRLWALVLGTYVIGVIFYMVSGA